MKTPGNGGIVPLFLTSTLDGCQWSTSCLGRSTTSKIPFPYYLLVWGPGRTQSRSGQCKKKKNLAMPGISSLARSYADSVIPYILVPIWQENWWISKPDREWWRRGKYLLLWEAQFQSANHFSTKVALAHFTMLGALFPIYVLSGTRVSYQV
jgi:hypothetical protein